MKTNRMIQQVISSQEVCKQLNQEVGEEWLKYSGRMGGLVSPYLDQRPMNYFAGLRGKPWWDAGEFPWTTVLETNFSTIRQELEDQLAKGWVGTGKIKEKDPKDYDFGEHLIEGEDAGWKMNHFLTCGQINERMCAMFPRTFEILQRIPGLCGFVTLAALLPRTHVKPHCGTTNAKLRCQFGIKIPDNCAFRIGNEVRGWEEGKCIIFDDSFEHEVWNNGDRVRYTLVFDFIHPDLQPHEAQWLIQRMNKLKDSDTFEEIKQAVIDNTARGRGRVELAAN